MALEAPLVGPSNGAPESHSCGPIYTPYNGTVHANYFALCILFKAPSRVLLRWQDGLLMFDPSLWCCEGADASVG